MPAETVVVQTFRSAGGTAGLKACTTTAFQPQPPDSPAQYKPTDIFVDFDHRAGPLYDAAQQSCISHRVKSTSC